METLESGMLYLKCHPVGIYAVVGTLSPLSFLSLREESKGGINGSKTLFGSRTSPLAPLLRGEGKLVLSYDIIYNDILK